MWASVLGLAVAALSAGWLQGCSSSDDGPLKVPPKDPERLVEPFRHKLTSESLWREQITPLVDKDTLTGCHTWDTFSLGLKNGEHRKFHYYLENITHAKSLSFSGLDNAEVALGHDNIITFSVDVVFSVQGLMFSGKGVILDDTPGKAAADRHNFSGIVVRQPKPGKMVVTWSGVLMENRKTQLVCTSRNHLHIKAPQTKVVSAAMKNPNGESDPLASKYYISQGALDSLATVYIGLDGCGWSFPWTDNDSAWCVDRQVAFV